MPRTHDIYTVQVRSLRTYIDPPDFIWQILLVFGRFQVLPELPFIDVEPIIGEDVGHNDQKGGQ